MKIMLLGPPGSGKGTQAQFICDKLGINKLSTGDMLRDAVAANTPIGNEVKQIMNTGGLVSNQLVLDLVAENLAQDKFSKGVLFDGFPRNVLQAETMQKQGIDLDHIFEISVSDTAVINRLTGRRVHPASGRTYHLKYNPPKQEGVDDITDEELIQREDDKPETVKARLKLYHEQTELLVSWYTGKAYTGNAKYHKINGEQEVNLVWSDIQALLV